MELVFIADGRECRAFVWARVSVPIVTPRGSALEAIPVRRAESTARVVLHRAFAAVSSLIPHIRKAAQAALQPSGAGVRSPKAKTTRDEDDYEDDFDEVSTVALVTECGMQQRVCRRLHPIGVCTCMLVRGVKEE